VKPKVKDGIFNEKNPEGGVLSLDFLFYRRRGGIFIEIKDRRIIKPRLPVR
jgi:hypothetical protein